MNQDNATTTTTTPAQDEIEEAKAPRRDWPVEVGNCVAFVLPDGEVRPAIAVRVWGPKMANLQVYTDGDNDARHFSERIDGRVPGLVWRTSVHYAPASEKQPHTWHWFAD